MSKLGIKRSTSTVRLCTDLDLAAQHENLQVALAAERAKPGTEMLAGNPEARRLAEEITGLEAQMVASTVVVTLRALTRKRWAELVAAHPPREDNEDDAAYRVNVSTFVDAAMVESIEKVTRADNSEVVDFAGTDWPEAADEMSNAQWNEFAVDLFRLNNGVTAGPTSRAASLLMRPSEANSGQPEA